MSMHFALSFTDSLLGLQHHANDLRNRLAIDETNTM
jgi:hypothetical protein